MLPFFIRPLYRPLFFFFAHLRVYLYHSITHSPSPTPRLTLSSSSHNSNICLLAFSSILLLSLLFVLAATNNVFRGFHGDLPLREIKIQPWFYSSKPKLLRYVRCTNESIKILNESNRELKKSVIFAMRRTITGALNIRLPGY